MSGFWIFMFVMVLLMPLAMVVFGALLLKKPPRLNGFFGYRTQKSMKNTDTWLFAQRFFGKIWLKLGAVILPISMIIMVIVLNEEVFTIAMTGLVVTLGQLVFLLAPIYPTEKALKEKFE